MSFFDFATAADPNAGRRAFVARSGWTLTAGAVALLAGRDSLAAQKKAGPESLAGDVHILNSALAAEYEGVAAYQVGAQSGLLQKPVLDLALQFQGHHKAHADLLAATVKKLGGTICLKASCVPSALSMAQSTSTRPAERFSRLTTASRPMSARRARSFWDRPRRFRSLATRSPHVEPAGNPAKS